MFNQQIESPAPKLINWFVLKSIRILPSSFKVQWTVEILTGAQVDRNLLLRVRVNQLPHDPAEIVVLEAAWRAKCVRTTVSPGSAVESRSARDELGEIIFIQNRLELNSSQQLGNKGKL